MAKTSAPDAAGQLQGRQANTAGRRMDQHALSRAEPAQVFQGVGRGQERDRQRRGFLEAEPGRLDRDQLGPRHDMTAEGEAGDRQHLVADVQAVDALADRRDPAAALGAERHGAVGQAGVHPQRLHHVTEIQAGGDDLDLDLARARRPPPQRLEDQAIERPGPPRRQAVRTAGLRRASRARRRQARCRHEAVDVPLGPAPGDLVLVVRGLDLLEERTNARRRRRPGRGPPACSAAGGIRRR